MNTPLTSAPAIKTPTWFQELPAFLRWSVRIQILGPVMVILSIGLFIGICALLALANYVFDLNHWARAVDIGLCLPFLLFYAGIFSALIPAPVHAGLCAAAAWRWRGHRVDCILCVLALLIEILLTTALIGVALDALFYWRHPEYLDDSIWPGAGIFTPEKDQR